MDVHETDPCHSEQLRLQDSPICDDDGNVERAAREHLGEFFVTVGLVERKPPLERGQLDRRLATETAPSPGTVRLRDHEVHVGDLDERSEAGNGRGRGSEERSADHSGARRPSASSRSSRRACLRTRRGSLSSSSVPLRWSISCCSTRPISSSPS